MFSGCTGLTSAPTLHAETLVTGCYLYMFNDCTGLTSLTTYQTSFTGCDDWLPENNGTFHCRGYLEIPDNSGRSASNVPSTWTVTLVNATVLKINVSAANTEFKMRISGTNFTIRWEDGATETIDSANSAIKKHTYETVGEYYIEISAGHSYLAIGSDDNDTTSKGMLTGVTQLCDSITSLNSAFLGCTS